ncbi:MAG: hypothetical protein WBA05_02870 [Gordonia sp. (in: high G+C Gram-positive bacteria)]|uniref:Vgb family protein n=1 Tax=Gordonia sp. (in: high G+C Gram-positive bacteria) TaxID=84139 RepID=UPI003C788704
MTLIRSELIADPSALFVDPRGRVWWVNATTRTLGRYDPAAPGPVRRFGPWPQYGAPRAWAVGADGTLWVTTQDAPGLLAVDAATDPAVRWHTDLLLRTPDGVCAGPDDSLWIADTAADAIVRYRPATGSWDRFTADGIAGPFDIKAGPDPAFLWFTNKRGDSLGRIRVAEPD